MSSSNVMEMVRPASVRLRTEHGCARRVAAQAVKPCSPWLPMTSIIRLHSNTGRKGRRHVLG